MILDLAPEGSARPFPLMLDTGASESILTPRMARDLGVSVRRVKDSPYRRATRLGRDVSFWVDDRRSDTASRTGWEYGVLGGSFLEQFVAEIDFGARRVRFLDPDRYRVPETTPVEGEAVLPLRFPSKCPQVEIAIGEHRALVTLDTGAPHPFILAGKIAGPASVETRAVPGLERGGTTVGPMDTRFAELPLLGLGPFRFERVPGLVAPKGWYNIGGVSESAIGAELLAHFVLRLDYPHERLWLRRLPDARMRLVGAVERGEPLAVVRPMNGSAVDLVLPQDAALATGVGAGGEDGPEE